MTTGLQQRRARLQRVFATLLALLLIGLLLWTGGLIWFAEAMPRRVADRSTRTDVIVVLTGGSGRLKEGVRLLAAGRARVLFVSGVNPQVRRSELLRLAGAPPPAIARRIVFGYRAAHTRGNAAEIALWFSTGNYRSLRLVTANYHMRRSLAELRHTMPKVRVIPHPVFPSGVTAGGWWRNGTAITVLIKEYNKYLAALVRLRFA